LERKSDNKKKGDEKNLDSINYIDFQREQGADPSTIQGGKNNKKKRKKKNITNPTGIH